MLPISWAEVRDVTGGGGEDGEMKLSPRIKEILRLSPLASQGAGGTTQSNGGNNAAVAL